VRSHSTKTQDSESKEEDVEELSKVKEELYNSLKILDANQDGFIDRDELFTILVALGVLDRSARFDVSSKLELVLGGLDTNGDGFVDLYEFLDWVLFNRPNLEEARPLQTRHIFLTPTDEARMERITLFELHAQENAEVMQQSSLGDLLNPKRLMLSIGSSSTQAYDCNGFQISVPTGTKVKSQDALSSLIEAVKGREYEQFVCINSIGYSCSDADPVLVSLEDLALRDAAGAPSRFHKALSQAFPGMDIQVFNRAKEPGSRLPKFAQLVNDFSVALTKGAGLPEEIGDFTPDTIVDWGGSSFKVFIGGKRVGTELMDANDLLCQDGFFYRDRLPGALEKIHEYVRAISDGATKVLIAQTGKTRELAVAGKIR